MDMHFRGDHMTYRLARSLEHGEQLAEAKGLTLEFGTVTQLWQASEDNRFLRFDPPLPHLRPNADGLTDDTFFCFLGYDAKRKVVAAQAARFFDLPMPLNEALDQQWIFYGDRDHSNSLVIVTGEAAGLARTVQGPIAYSGAGWNHPDFRNKGLSTILPRMSHMYAVARWNVAHVMSVMRKVLAQKGVVKDYGYTRYPGDVVIDGMLPSRFEGVLGLRTREEILDGTDEFLRRKQ